MNLRQQLRKQGRQARQAISDREQQSTQIVERLFAQPVFSAADWVLFYVHVRTEVQTQAAIPQAAAAGKQIAVPYCVGDQLKLFHWQQADDLIPATFGILEPRPELLLNERRHVAPQQIDVVLVPGLIFDLRGHRLGSGRGYYDRLLTELPASTTRIGLAFDCQIMASLPNEPHDRPVDFILTPSRLIACRC